MNLMTMVIESIYKYGNATLQMKENPKWEITFCVENNGELKIQVKKEFKDGYTEEYNFNSKDGLYYITLLVYYSLCENARKHDLVHFTNIPQRFNQEMAITAINELYQQIIPTISITRHNIQKLATCGSEHEMCQALSNLAKHVDTIHPMLSIKDIMKSLLDKYGEFKRVLSHAQILWKKVKDASNSVDYNDADNNFEHFLNYIYIQEFSDSTKTDLNNINVVYEFLTSKKYISDPAIQCENEIKNLEIALLTPRKSVILVGPPGVGKTAIMEGLAYRITTGQAPHALLSKKILKINTSSIISGCTLVGMLEQKIEKIMQYLIENPDTILCIDEIHTAIGAGRGSSCDLDLANILKPYIDRGQCKVIGATTDIEYEKHIKNDPAFNRRFIKINVHEPQSNVVCHIIRETIKKLEQQTGVNWTFEKDVSEMIINHIVECTNDKNRIYNDKRYNPDLSITILETVFAIASLNGFTDITIECIVEAIKRCEVLYERVRIASADTLLSKYNSITSSTGTTAIKCKIYQFPTGQFIQGS